ncbi:Imm63 family immunity protein [Xanthomonas oryzae]|uniref:Imm63 family immunity protein n=1 Tax=Xanthomonas oryzae TaxID=347 RepID=UPI0010344199|nr:Imm63 family immunity protein [Xanthomonas oryzae]QBG97652.1 hypothetical protein EYC55_22855 [Xanthomonas oryzae]QBH01642.1 hypothetical protein EYC56_23505 [Xanthomonas oryzae]
MIIQLEDIQSKVYEIGKKINAPRNLLLVRSQPADDGAPYLSMNDGLLFYASSERGYEIFRKSVTSLDDLLYLIFNNATAIMAMGYELKNRIEGQDSRRMYFSKRVELMNELDPKWGNRVAREIDEILSSAPYVDG